MENGEKKQELDGKEKLGESFEKLYNLKEEPALALAGHGIPRFGKEAEVIRLAYKYYLKFDR